MYSPFFSNNLSSFRLLKHNIRIKAVFLALIQPNCTRKCPVTDITNTDPLSHQITYLVKFYSIPFFVTDLFCHLYSFYLLLEIGLSWHSQVIVTMSGTHTSVQPTLASKHTFPLIRCHSKYIIPTSADESFSSDNHYV